MACFSNFGRSCVDAASKNIPSFSFLNAPSRSVDQRSKPYLAASSLTFCALRPIRIGSGTRRVPSFSATPPCLRISRIERTKCWFMPMRPVTPCMMMPIRFCAIALFPDEFERDAIRVANVDELLALVRALVNRNGWVDRGDPIARSRSDCRVHVVDIERKVREPGVAWACDDASFRCRRLVLDQLHHLSGAAHERDLHVGTFDTRYLLDDFRIARRARHELETQAFGEERQRTVEARHGEAGVIRAQHAEAHLGISFIERKSGIARLAEPGQSSESIASSPFSIRTRTAPWLCS